MTPTFRLECQKCHQWYENSEFPMIPTGIVERAPMSPDGLRYTRCKCGKVSRWEVSPNFTMEELLAWYRWVQQRHVDREAQRPQKAA